MPRRFFKLTDDVYLSGRWELGHPLDQEGRKLDDQWQFSNEQLATGSVRRACGYVLLGVRDAHRPGEGGKRQGVPHLGRRTHYGDWATVRSAYVISAPALLLSDRRGYDQVALEEKDRSGLLSDNVCPHPWPLLYNLDVPHQMLALQGQHPHIPMHLRQCRPIRQSAISMAVPRLLLGTTANWMGCDLQAPSNGNPHRQTGPRLRISDGHPSPSSWEASSF
ncbi:hypothetical protein D7Y04_12835 [Corallococcus sp. AB038B]|nr:hypothetical protein D7Y04_12835 [Corallococcus sp. AB038B]